MAEPLVLVERHGPVGVATLNRPAVLNALGNDLLAELVGALEGLDSDDSIRVLVVTGGPQVFAAGADLRQLAEAPDVEAFVAARRLLWDRLARVGKPLVGAVSGYALGAGCELAMHCDLIVASETARFGQPEINVGLMPGAGGTQRLARLIGKVRAMELVLTGRPMSAYEAERAGLVNRVVPAEVLADEALALARELAEKPPISLRHARDAVRQALEATLTEGLEYERSSFGQVLQTEDAREGITAFIEKRKPAYHGR